MVDETRCTRELGVMEAWGGRQMAGDNEGQGLVKECEHKAKDCGKPQDKI